MKKYFFAVILFAAIAVPARADVLGESHIFFVSTEYDSRGRDHINATLRGTSDRAYFYVADEYWNELGQLGQSQLLVLMGGLGNEFDRRIYSLETAFFGSEPNPGIDGDPKLTLVLANLRSGVGGYFDSSNEYPKMQIANSNEREMIFLNTAYASDPPRLYPFLAHEFQHLISFNQKEKLRGISDDIWLNELRSEYAIQYLGYNTPYQGSNLERRAQAFLDAPSDSVTEWKNYLADYGQVALLGTYIGEHWSPRVIADTLTSSFGGISSINDSLARNGYHDTFQDIFERWMFANSLKVPPTLLTSSITDTANLDVALALKDWEQHWYDIRSFAMGANSTLKISFEGDLASLRVPYVVFLSDGTTAIRTVTSPTILIPDVGATASRVLLMPYTSQKLSGSSSNEPIHGMTMHFTRVAPQAIMVRPEQFNLQEGDFIRAEGDKDIFIINQHGYKRIVLSPKICLQYGHLGARGCFSAVHIVSPSVRDAFTTSPYYTNGETNDDKVYQLIETGEDSAYLKDLHTMLYAFNQNNFDAYAVFRINSHEQKSYQ